jgi:serine/threonine protein kinase
LSGARPFEETKETTIFSAIKSGKYRFPDNPWKTISEEAKQIIRCMLTVDPSKRITAKEAMEHAWMKPDGVNNTTTSTTTTTVTTLTTTEVVTKPTSPSV